MSLVLFCWRFLAFSFFCFCFCVSYFVMNGETLTYAGRLSSWPLRIWLAVPRGCIWYSVAIVARVCCCASHSETRVQCHVTIGWAAQAWTCQYYKDASNRIDTELRSKQYLGDRAWMFVDRRCDSLSLPLINSWDVQIQELLLLAVNDKYLQQLWQVYSTLITWQNPNKPRA